MGTSAVFKPMTCSSACACSAQISRVTSRGLTPMCGCCELNSLSASTGCCEVHSLGPTQLRRKTAKHKVGPNADKLECHGSLCSISVPDCVGNTRKSGCTGLLSLCACVSILKGPAGLVMQHVQRHHTAVGHDGLRVLCKLLQQRHTGSVSHGPQRLRCLVAYHGVLTGVLHADS
eukprot:GHRQ01030146.1.p1 GENE.GHRQ01030146.1~~GHRQ01030146.1.p1  ORF type:complete len:175 (+),score=9.35 GHRQ01030146.1:587-1111(+)